MTPPSSDGILINGTNSWSRSNGDTTIKAISRPKRDDHPFELDSIFRNTTEGRLLKGLTRSYLIKQEPRMGWARKGACSETELVPYPCESVAAHQWGVSWLLNVIARTEGFKLDYPNFDRNAAYDMAIGHDLAELVTGDITPVDGISSDDKHRLESQAMTSILSAYPQDVSKDLEATYKRYEERECIESRFVKDCDKLDFIITAFVLELQGFRGFAEFYPNTNKNFFTRIAQSLAEELIATRTKFFEAESS